MRGFLLGFVFAALGLAAFGEQQPTRVSITSQPQGASVIVDGQDRGTTPITLFDLKPGRHHLKYRLAGYVERDRFFNTNEEGPFIEKSEVLVEEKGLLLIKTDPAGCDIAIDGVSVGQSPRLITHLAAKDTYSVRLRKAGYQDQTITVRFEGRKPVVREEKLVLASGTLDVMSDPPGAEVMINGIVRGKTPLKVTEIPKGRAVVKFRLDGFADESRELSVNAGDKQTLSVMLTGLPGTLQLSSVPEGARFYVNDEPRGKGPLAIPGLKPGDYVVRAELEGYGTMTKTITLANGGSANEEFRLSNTMGRLEVRTSPAGVTVSLDGHVAGVTKSAGRDVEFSDVLTIESILEGEHTLVLTKEGYSEMVGHPKIESNKTSQYRLRLRRIFVPDVEIVTARGTYTGVLVSNSPEAVVVEVSLGITRSFPRDEIREINFLTSRK